ncbi:MAG: thiamine-phosphate kinase [Cytophagaceae bacterium]|nr:thiamine-phosphate kinase [Cytophagaceae bacterium]MDW8455474.1 thiamine-phosphate kinase [Cytophagaceae bacterium]
MNNSSRTDLSTLGEFGLINRIKSNTSLRNKESIIGIGDDAAVLYKNENEYTLLSTDLLIEGIHFDLTYCPLVHLGYKAVIVNLSDIAAMNGIPQQITVSLAISNRFSVEAIDELYKGIEAACKKYSVDLVGGDTTSSKTGLLISVTAVGTVSKQKLTLRKGAAENNIICVTGDLGAAYMGLQVLEREKQVFLANPDMQPELFGKEYIIQRQLKPEARTDIIHEFLSLSLQPTSMMDISDGLASEILHLCHASDTGAIIYEEKLPIDPMTYETAREFQLDATTCVMNGGEDYELVFTLPLSDYDKIKNHPSITVVGYMTPKHEGVKLMSRGGNLYDIKAQGWKHF